MSPKPSFLTQVTQSPMFWGTLLVSGFYLAIPAVPVGQEFLQRYFCSHIIEYVTTGLFGLGMAILFTKTILIGVQRKATSDAIGRLEAISSDISVEHSQNQMREIADHLATREQVTYAWQQLDDTHDYIRLQGIEDLHQFLKDQASLAHQKLSESYSLLMTINKAVPMLGFLGTVIGITLAIAHVTPEQLNESLGSVTGGLAVAFDTTALSMGLSLLLIFGYLTVFSWERDALRDWQSRFERHMLRLFATGPQLNPVEQVQQEMATELQLQSQKMLAIQLDQWKQSLAQLQNSWHDTWQQQQATLLTQSETLQTLGQEELAQGWKQIREQATEEHRLQLESLRGAQELQTDQLQQLHGELHTQLGEVCQELKASVSTMQKAAEQFATQAESLAQLQQESETLTKANQSFADGLALQESSEKLDDTLHSLSAAVHLLTTRAKPDRAA